MSETDIKQLLTNVQKQAKDVYIRAKAFENSMNELAKLFDQMNKFVEHFYKTYQEYVEAMNPSLKITNPDCPHCLGKGFKKIDNHTMWCLHCGGTGKIE